MKSFPVQLISIRFLVLIILMITINNPVIAQKKKVKTSKRWSMELSMQSGYDNNALRYSDKYLQRFKNNEDKGRFHIKKYDDLVMDYTARISYSERFIKNMLSVFTARINYNQYTFNTIKTWYQIDLMYQQYITQKTSLMFSYSYLPEFYVAHFRDNDWVKMYGYTPITFQPYTFSKNDFSFWLQHNFNTNTRVRVYFSLMKYYYNKHFTEYDSDNYLTGVRVSHNLSPQLSLDAAYKFVRSNAKGFDELGEDKLTSDDADATYNEHNISLGAAYKMPRIFNLDNKINFSVELFRRYYLTDKTVTEDQLHSGRNDLSYRIGLKYDFAILKNLTTGLYFNYAFRNAQSSNITNNEFISDEKDYDQAKCGVSVLYKLQF
ncbi:MAG: autotransporter outer membrane beta-barrel domain-containing protein [Ignavibacterium sp.]|jgi:hypothetical protein|nr:autotransporter outer membrane beta-barrel domain-containing protein [Ignavibacterium sp.]